MNPAAGTTTTYYVRAEGICNTTDCASGQVIVLPAAPVQPDVIAGISPVCPGTTGLNYSISIVNDAIDYVWSVPGGWTITAGHVTNSITVTAGSSGQNGNISVTAQNTCGTSAPSLLPVIVSPGVPATPGLITGGTNQCINRTGLNYSISAVPGAISYSWTVPTGWTIVSGQNTISITVSTSPTAASGNITVIASNSCGTSSASS